ncbi:MAG: amidohydrolase family protein [Syntrophomonadaceae bacterium]|nr:amidohydrolase family protein [Syntrophomonadaceae bacterium]
MILDAHAHCGLSLPYEKIRRRWQEGGIEGGLLIPPVEEVYDRYDYSFTDSPFYQSSRQQVHQYLRSLPYPNLYRLWFVWNDFALPGEGFSGIKWHRHPYEPHYNYSSPACEAFIQYVVEKQLPIMFEEEFSTTLEFVKRIDGRTVIIIPHMGGLNGGYRSLKQAGLFARPNIWVDTALGTPDEIMDFVHDYGFDRIMFGSDYPFGDPASEKRKVERLFTGEERDRLLSLNAVRLFGPASGQQ